MISLTRKLINESQDGRNRGIVMFKKRFYMSLNKPNSHSFSLLPFINYWWLKELYILAFGWEKWSFSINMGTGVKK